MASCDSGAMPYAFLLVVDVLVIGVDDLRATGAAGILVTARAAIATAAAGGRRGRRLGPLGYLDADLLRLRVQRVDRPSEDLRVVRGERLPQVLDPLLDGLLRRLGDLVPHLAGHLLRRVDPGVRLVPGLPELLRPPVLLRVGLRVPHRPGDLFLR